MEGESRNSLTPKCVICKTSSSSLQQFRNTNDPAFETFYEEFFAENSQDGALPAAIKSAFICEECQLKFNSVLSTNQELTGAFTTVANLKRKLAESVEELDAVAYLMIARLKKVTPMDESTQRETASAAFVNGMKKASRNVGMLREQLKVAIRTVDGLKLGYSFIGDEDAEPVNAETNECGNDVTRKRKRSDDFTPPNDDASIVSPPNDEGEAGSGETNQKRSKTTGEQFSPDIEATALRDITNKLCTVVRDGDLTALETLLLEKSVKEVLKKSTLPENKDNEDYNKVATLIHSCVGKSWKDDYDVISQKRKMIKMLVEINNSLLEFPTPAREEVPLLCRQVHPKLLSTLLKLGANPCSVDCWKTTLLHRLAHDIDEAEMLMESALETLTEKLPATTISAFLSMRDNWGYTPLMALTGSSQQHKFLIFFQKAGVDFNEEDREDGYSPLAKAIANGCDVGMVTNLVQFGSSLAWKHKDDETTLLHLAAVQGSESVVKFLVEEKNFNVNVLDKEGLTPLDKLILQFDFFHGDKTAYFNTALTIKRLGGEFHQINGQTIFNEYESFESLENFIVTLKLLLRLNVPVNEKDEDGNTLLHLAYEDAIPIPKTTFNFQAESEIEYLQQKQEVIELLLKHGADTKAKNNKNKTPLQMLKKNPEMEEYRKKIRDFIIAKRNEVQPQGQS